jgi:hypothetical protein
MKKLLVAVAVLGLVCAASFTTVKADDSGAATDKKAFRKEMLDKYDLNKDGKLDKDEKSKMTPEDLEKWNKTFPHHKKAATDSSTSSSASTNAPVSK